MQIQIKPFLPNTVDLSEIQIEARGAGFRFVDRFVEKFASNENRFDQIGEKLLGAFCDETLIGFGGLNRDPYERKIVGRIRHLYVKASHRRLGVGNAIVANLIEDTVFDTIQLRTPNETADRFYEALGFAKVTSDHASHRLKI